jgi:radical SAM superfamily enzyme YgiQ (UPF0313 family)
MEKVYGYLKQKGWNLRQVQAFIPTPMTLATAMYWTGIDPMTKKQLFVAKEWKDRKIQQALLQPHKPGHREILQKYRIEKHRHEVAGGAKKDYGTCDSRAPTVPRKRSVVDAPKRKMGTKLLLDTR